MAPNKTVKRKTRKPRRKATQLLVEYIGGNPPLRMSEEILKDANWGADIVEGTGTVTYFDRALIADIFKVPAWLLGWPYAPIARSAQQLKALAGPGPYHCNTCGASYKFYHPPCKPSRFAAGGLVRGPLHYIVGE
jgi:hypothetical protein